MSKYVIPNDVVASSIAYTATVAIMSQGPNLQGIGADNSKFTKIVPTEAGNTDWNMWVGKFANAGARDNHVMRFGWNIDGGGSRETTGVLNGALASEYEQFYESINAMERHEVFIDPNDRISRWLSFEGRVAAPFTTRLFINADTLFVGRGKDSSDNDGALTLSATDTQLRSIDGFKRVRLDNDQVNIEAGTTNTPTTYISLDENGDARIYGARGYFGGLITGVRVDWTATATDLFSPDAQTNVYLDDNGIQLIAGGVLNLKLTPTANEVRVPVQPQNDVSSATSLGASNKRWFEAWSQVFAGVHKDTTSSGSVSIDTQLGEMQVLTSSGNITGITLTAGKHAQRFTLELVQGNAAHTWSSVITNARLAGGAFTKSTNLNDRDVLTFQYNSTDSKWDQISPMVTIS